MKLVLLMTVILQLCAVAIATEAESSRVIGDSRSYIVVPHRRLIDFEQHLSVAQQHKWIFSDSKITFSPDKEICVVVSYYTNVTEMASYSYVRVYSLKSWNRLLSFQTSIEVCGVLFLHHSRFICITGVGGTLGNSTSLLVLDTQNYRSVYKVKFPHDAGQMYMGQHGSLLILGGSVGLIDNDYSIALHDGTAVPNKRYFDRYRAEGGLILLRVSKFPWRTVRLSGQSFVCFWPAKNWFITAPWELPAKYKAWDCQTLRPINQAMVDATLPKIRLDKAGIALDGHMVVTVNHDNDKEIDIYTGTSPVGIHRITYSYAPHIGYWPGLFSLDGMRMLLPWSSIFPAASGLFHLYNTRTGNCIASIPDRNHEAEMLSRSWANFSTLGRYIFDTGGRHGIIDVYSSRDGHFIARIGSGPSLEQVWTSPDDRYIIRESEEYFQDQYSSQRYVKQRLYINLLRPMLKH